MKNNVFVYLLLFTFFSIHAQDQKDGLITDRPDATESATIVPLGSLQIETGAMLEHYETTTNYVYNTTLIRLGLTKNIELRVINEYLGYHRGLDGANRTAKGFSPLSIGSKIQIAKENKYIPEVAFIGHITFRTGDQEFQPSYIAPDFRISLAYTLSEAFSLGINLGAEWDGEVPSATGIYTIALGLSVSERLGFYAELFGYKIEQMKNPDHRFDAGFTYLLKDLIQLDFFLGHGLSEISPHFFVGVGTSFRLFK